MKKIIMINVSVWVFALASSFLSSVAQAHTWGARLPAAADAATTYSIACYNDGNGETSKLFFNIQGKTRVSFNVMLVVRKKLDNGETIQAEPVVDKTNADGKPSLPGELKGGNGTYLLTISKIPSQAGGGTGGVMVYSFDFHCETASGAHTGTQEQPTVVAGPVDPIDPVDPVDPQIPTQPVNPKVATFSGSLGKFATEKRYQVTCSPAAGQPTARYWFRLRGATKNRPFSVRLTVSTDGEEQVVTDANSNDTGFGEWGYIEGGDGPYILSIEKVSETGENQGTMAFKVRHACEADKGLRTKTSKPRLSP